MKLVLAAAKLVQFAILVCAGCLFLQSLFLSAQTFFMFFYPTTNVPYLHPVQATNETSDSILLAWKEPFEYEAKVYISSESFRSSTPETFFQNAVEVWHVEPQSLENRYPAFDKHVTLDLTSTETKFMTVFIQMAGQFTPYPNTSDPHLLVNENMFAFTTRSTSCYDDSKKGGVGKRRCVSNSEFRVHPKAVWKIHLEDNVYTTSTLLRIGCNKCTTFHGQPLSLDNTTENTRASNMYLPLLDTDSGSIDARRTFPLIDDDTVFDKPRAIETSIDLVLEIRGVRTSMERVPNRIEDLVTDKVNTLLKADYVWLLRPRLHFDSRTFQSMVSTVVFIALYPALLSLWLLRRLLTVRLFFTSVYSDGALASALPRVYLLMEHSRSYLILIIGLIVPHAGLQTVLLKAFFAYSFVTLVLANMPQGRVAKILRYFAGSPTTTSNDSDKDERPHQLTIVSEEDEAKMAYDKSSSLVFRLLIASVAASFAIEFIHDGYIAGDIAIPAPIEFDSNPVDKFMSALASFIPRFFDWAPAAYYVPTILMAFKCKSVVHVPITYHILRIVEFATIGLLCLYAVPSVFDPDYVAWPNVVNFFSSVVLLIQWAIYNKV